MYMYTHIYTQTHMHMYTHIYTQTHMYIYIYTHIYTHRHICMCIYIYIHTDTCMCVHIYIHTDTYVYVCAVLCLVTQLCPALIPWTVALKAPLSRGILHPRILEWVAMPSPPGDLPKPGIKPRSPTLHTDFLPSEPPGKRIYMKHDSTFQKGILPFMTTWMNLEDIMLVK